MPVKVQDQALQIAELRPRNYPAAQKAGCETWSTAWSPHGNLFAWSCGTRIVKIVPWYKIKYNRDVDDDNNGFINNHGFSHRTNSETNPTGRDSLRKTITIDAGELIWALAFGSSTAEMRPQSVNLNIKHFFSCKGLILATGLNSGRIRTWDVATGKLMLELIDHREVIRDLKFAPDGSLLLVSGSRDGTLKVWDIHDDGNMTKTMRGISKWVYACAWSPDAKLLASVGTQKTVLIWNMSSYQIERKLDGHFHDVVSCDFSPDGALLATSSYDTRVIIWDPYTGEKLKTLCHLFPPPHFMLAGGANGTYVRSVSFSHDGTHVATIADDSYVRFWHVFNDHNPEQIAAAPNALTCSFSPDGSVLAVGTRNGSVSFWGAPMRCETLQDLCRMALRRVTRSPVISKLPLPLRLKEFLEYKRFQF
ncbi:WD repeat and SOCS box-containing protein 1-like isoform X2 [Lineus longissimus]|uniref:WD repeat and SOCS box-containing protein 1-like isoform X2 n=1 Tax=Lineus longissimus TaxID=88925 RepID=UPI002B4C8719